MLEWFPFGFDGIGFLELFTNQRWVQTAGAKFPLNSSPTLSFMMKAGLDEGFDKLSVVKISGGLHPLDDQVDGYRIGARPEKFCSNSRVGKGRCVSAFIALA